MDTLIKYAKLYIKVAAFLAIMKVLKKQAKSELKKCVGSRATVLGVMIHMTNKPKRIYPPDIQALLDEHQTAIEQIKETAEKAGKVTIKNKPTFDCEIPKPDQVELFSRHCAEYREHFSQK